MDAIYFLSPQPHIIECLLADFEQRRYKRAFLVWAGELAGPLEARIQPYRQQIAGERARPPRIGQIKLTNHHR